LVAMDAVGVVGDSKRPKSVDVVSSSIACIGKPCSVLPLGPRVYVSGQAEKGDGTLADATKQTLASLERTLDFLGLSKTDVIQVKSFLGPMTNYADAERAIVAFFGESDTPPCVFVEWQSGLPIEIELIVSAKSNSNLAKGTQVEVRTPPGMTTPAVYSRLTISRHPAVIYTSGLYPSDATASPESQLRSLFANLKQTLDLTGSDWMHLVKATYYVNDNELNKWHNVVRPDYFSPRRPPAASKANVRSVGKSGHGIMMDFIMVPGEP
jgi:enamine deaminase RidA (YjgF/YER057c/UK114 family)